jgi:hypothetical protein
MAAEFITKKVAQKFGGRLPHQINNKNKSISFSK